MIYSGHHCRRIGQTKRLSLQCSLSVDDLRGSGCIAISGMSLDGTEHKDLKFQFVQGKIIDPEDRYVYSYLPDRALTLSGNFYDDDYNYYINGEPMCFVGAKDPIVVENFYINTYDCNLAANIYVSSDQPNYKIIMGDSFSKEGSLYVNVKNNSSLPFYIFDANFITDDIQPSNVGLPNAGDAMEVGISAVNVIFAATSTAVIGTYANEELTLNTSVGDLIKTGINLTLTEEETSESSQAYSEAPAGGEEPGGEEPGGEEPGGEEPGEGESSCSPWQYLVDGACVDWFYCDSDGGYNNEGHGCGTGEDYYGDGNNPRYETEQECMCDCEADGGYEYQHAQGNCD